MQGEPTEERHTLTYHEILSLLLRVGYRMEVANHLAMLICDSETMKRREKECEELKVIVKDLLEKHNLEKFLKKKYFW